MLGNIRSFLKAHIRQKNIKTYSRIRHTRLKRKIEILYCNYMIMMHIVFTHIAPIIKSCRSIADTYLSCFAPEIINSSQKSDNLFWREYIFKNQTEHGVPGRKRRCNIAERSIPTLTSWLLYKCGHIRLGIPIWCLHDLGFHFNGLQRLEEDVGTIENFRSV